MGEMKLLFRSGGLQQSKPRSSISVSNTRPLRAFTLFELLMAMSVIAIIAGITFAKVDLRIFRDTPTAGVRTLGDLMRVARTQAILNGVPARLIINYDEDDHERFLRYAGVLVASRGDDGMLENWIAVDRGVYLPTGAYVVPHDSSKVTFSADWGSGRKSRYDVENTGGVPALFRYEYPLNEPVPETVGPQWIALQFGPNGQLQAATEDGSGPQPVANYFVVGRARQTGDKALLFMDGETVKGIGVKRSGALFSIDDVDYYESKVNGGDEDEKDEDTTGASST